MHYFHISPNHPNQRIVWKSTKLFLSSLLKLIRTWNVEYACHILCRSQNHTFVTMKKWKVFSTRTRLSKRFICFCVWFVPDEWWILWLFLNEIPYMSSYKWSRNTSNTNIAGWFGKCVLHKQNSIITVRFDAHCDGLLISF